jgi:hypothetical protein
MTAPDLAAPFRFDASYDTRDARPNLATSRGSTRRAAVFTIWGAIGVTCLFWRFTIALGVAMLGLMIFAWVIEKRSEVRRKRYERIQQPSQIVQMTLTESGYSLKGDDFFAEAKWSNVFNALEMNGSLIVQSWQGPRLRVPMDELRRAGVYERVRAIVDARSPMLKGVSMGRGG